MRRMRLAQMCWPLLAGLAANGYAASNPILVVSGGSDKFSFYNAEILRAEGFNSFDTLDISAVNAKALSGYDVVVLGHVTLTPRQVNTVTAWVNEGGNLIVMRPDRQLAPLLGIRSAGSTLSNGYLRVDTSAAPGKGIVSETMQFHAAADLYALDGASSIAMLYSNRSNATPYPAVTMRRGIGRGGSAAAFTYDLARSVVYTRQGNPDWAKQARIGEGGPIRAVDMFYGKAKFDPQSDWVDLNNISIPQADEQQRLLANIILHLNDGKKPLPRFWYFPFNKKAVVIMTGDDHAKGATVGRFDDFIASSPKGCVVANWDCVRATSYIFPNTPITAAQAEKYTAQGFEIAVHTSSKCDNWTPESLEAAFTSQFSDFGKKLPGIPAPTTNRTHCIAWSDWTSEAEIELKHGVRLDTNYYYWPQSWVIRTPGLFTGSGIPMRFAKTDGEMIDVYQATTQMPDESGEVFPDFIDGLLDNAIGPKGFYGAFTANMHTDFNGGSFPRVHHFLKHCFGEFCSSQLWADQIVASAKKRGVPVISARQMLTWLDGRGTSSFQSLAWDGEALTFKVAAGSGARGLNAMIPLTSGGRRLSGMTKDGVPARYKEESIKGVSYIVFPADSGTYRVTYGTAATPMTGLLPMGRIRRTSMNKP